MRMQKLVRQQINNILYQECSNIIFKVDEWSSLVSLPLKRTIKRVPLVLSRLSLQVRLALLEA